MTKSEYLAKIKLANEWSDKYYNSNPVATDEEYDKLIKEILEYELTNPVHEDSPTNRVGYFVNEDKTTKKIKRSDKMYSLNNVYNVKELVVWLNKMRMYLNINCKFTVSPKYDGCSLEVCYDNNGYISYGATRGDGYIGEVITDNAKAISTVPESISISDTGSSYTFIRGEVVVENQVFEKINTELKSSGKTQFSNPRNYASGSLRVLDANITKERQLVFIPWGVIGCDRKVSYYETMKTVYDSSNEFYEAFWKFRLCSSIEDVIEAVKEIEDNRKKFNIALDGCVITVDDITLQKKLGYTAKAPRFSIAYKFPPTEVATTLIGIEPRVAGTGVITPVGLIQPVTIDGKVIKKVTLHNYNHISEKDIRINDKVSVILSGEVIPKIVNVFKDRRTGKELVIEKPTICFTCGNPVKEVGAKIVCENCKK